MDYFLPDVTVQQRRLLRVYQVEAREATVMGRSGFVLSSRDCHRALRLLGLQVINTDFDAAGEIEVLHCAPIPLEDLAVTYSHPNSPTFEAAVISLARRTLLPAVRREIKIISAGNRRLGQNRVEDHRFRVWIWTSPDESGVSSTPGQMWGVGGIGPQERCAPLDVGEFTIVTPEGDTVAELIDNNLFIFHHADCKGLEGELTILSHIFEQVAACLSGEVEPARREATPSAFRVSIGSWEGENSAAFLTPVREILLPVVRKNVVIDVPHGRLQVPKEDGRFHIFVWSGPNEPRIVAQAPSVLWGRRVPCRDAGFDSSGMGLNIIDDASGWPVAELIGDNLFIHFDAVHTGNPEEVEIFRTVLERTVELLTMSDGALAAKRAEAAAWQRERARSRFIQDCLSLQKNEVAKLEMTRRDQERQAATLQNQLVQIIREAAVVQRSLDALTRAHDGSTSRYAETYDRIAGVSGVVSVGIQDSHLAVTTNVLTCSDPRTGKRHRLGAFRIIISLSSDGERSLVHITNLTQRVSGWQRGMMAPYVTGDGKPCTGNLSGVLPKLIAEFAYDAVVQVVIGFLQTVDVNDPFGRHLDKWPAIVEDATATTAATAS